MTIATFSMLCSCVVACAAAQEVKRPVLACNLKAISADDHSARKWRSMTLVILPEPAPFARLGSQRAESEGRSAYALAQACRHAAISARPTDIRVQEEPFLVRGEMAGAYSPGRFEGRLRHAEIAFEQPIRGPLLIGDGRFVRLTCFRLVSESWRPEGRDHCDETVHRRSLVTAGGDGFVVQWDVATGQELRRTLQADVTALTLLDDGIVVLGLRSGQTRTWNMLTGADGTRFLAHFGTVTSVHDMPPGLSTRRRRAAGTTVINRYTVRGKRLHGGAKGIRLMCAASG